MKVPITNGLKAKIFAALLAAGVAGPSAFIAANLTVPSEGVLTHTHLDPVGLKTMCIGHLLKKGEVDKKNYTIDECIEQFVKDWKAHEKIVDDNVKVPFKSPWMRGALTDFTFNKGGGAFIKSSILKDLNNRNYDRACQRLNDWVYGTINGKKVVLKGLEIRASKQYKSCMGEIPGDYQPMMIMLEGGVK